MLKFTFKYTNWWESKGKLGKRLRLHVRRDLTVTKSNICNQMHISRARVELPMTLIRRPSDIFPFRGSDVTAVECGKYSFRAD